MLSITTGSSDAVECTYAGRQIQKVLGASSVQRLSFESNHVYAPDRNLPNMILDPPPGLLTGSGLRLNELLSKASLSYSKTLF